MRSRSLSVPADAVLWGTVGWAFLALGFGVWQGRGPSFSLKVCFSELPQAVMGRPLYWHGIVIGRVVAVIPPQGADSCTWADLRMRNAYRHRIPVDSVVYLRADSTLELIALDPGAPPLRSGMALPGRPEAVAAVERAWLERLQQTRDLLSGWIREFHKWSRSTSAPADLQGARQALEEGLRRRSVLGPCPSWSERQLAYLVMRQWADLRVGLDLPASDPDPVLRGLRRLWTTPACDPTRSAGTSGRPIPVSRRGPRP